MTHTTTVGLAVHINGNPVATYQHEGKTFVEGREGTEFSLRITNPHPFRVKAVLSVDGVNVVSGQPASGDKDETGYVLSSGESQTILGFRLSDEQVARFRFTKAEAGYAQAEKGLQGTTGVIALRAWREKPEPALPLKEVIREIHHHHDHWHDRWYTPWWSSQPYWGTPYYSTITCGGGASSFTLTNNAATFGCSNSAGDTLLRCNATAQRGDSNVVGAVQSSAETNPFELGVTWGQKAESKVDMVGFAADTMIDEVTVYHTTRAGLIALGVDVSRKSKVAFPAAFSGQWATPPKGWTG